MSNVSFASIAIDNVVADKSRRHTQLDSIDQSLGEKESGLQWVEWIEWVVGGLRYLVLMMPVAAATVAAVFPGKAFASLSVGHVLFYVLRACASVCGSSHFIVDSLNFQLSTPLSLLFPSACLCFTLVMRHVRIRVRF